MERAKGKAAGKEIDFIVEDIRKIKLNTTLDSVITTFNAIGHLTHSGFEMAIRNIYSHLNQGGLYILIFLTWMQ